MSLCACGCGQDAGVYVENGKSKRFIHGHNRKAAKKEQCVKGQIILVVLGKRAVANACAA